MSSIANSNHTNNSSELPVLDLTVFGQGWGPSMTDKSAMSVLAKFQGLPFQQYNKCDRVGRVVDWLGTERYYKKSDMRDRYNERLYGSAATAGSQFDYVHDNEDATFQLVDTSKPQKPQKPYRRGFQFRKFFQKDFDRREQERYGQSQKAKREIEKEKMRAFKIWQRRGGGMRGAGGGGRMGRRYGYADRQAGKGRQPSIEVRPEWKVLEELDFQRLSKLSLPSVESGRDIKGESYGMLYYIDRAVEKASLKAPIPLRKCGGAFYSTTTTDDPVIVKLSQQNIGNVFGTDIILATLMAATRSIYSWDIVVQRRGTKLFFDKRNSTDISNPIDALTVSENAPEMLQESGQKMAEFNTPHSLAIEALYINQNFRRQALKQNEKPFPLEHESLPFDEDDASDGDKQGCQIGYRYRTWNLGNMSDGKPINLVVRTEVDAVMKSTDTGAAQYVTVKAFNEWDSSIAGGLDWRSKLETQKAAVLATEVRNNSFKVAKWTIQSILAGSDYLRFGYVSRVGTRNPVQHEILGIHQARPIEFAKSVGMNLDNCWGILRTIIDFFMKQPVGKYLMLKDPVQGVVRIYSLPDEESSSSGSESESASNDEEGA